MEAFVIVFVVLAVWLALAAGGNARACRAGYAGLSCLAAIGLFVGFVIFVVIPLTIAVMALGLVFV